MIFLSSHDLIGLNYFTDKQIYKSFDLYLSKSYKCNQSRANFTILNPI